MRGLFGLYGLRDTTSVRDATADAQRAASDASQATLRTKALEQSLAKTLLICETLWELLREQTGLRDEDLYAKLQEIDLRDGVLDGKNQLKTMACESCNRPVSNRHARCLYCGHTFERSAFQLS